MLMTKKTHGVSNQHLIRIDIWKWIQNLVITFAIGFICAIDFVIDY